MAHKWSDRRNKPQTAVIVFMLIGGDDIFFGKDGLQFNEDSDQWSTVIRYFRNKMNAKSANIPLPEAKTLKRKDYIFGPIADDNMRPVPKSHKWKPRAFKPLKYQLCLQTQEMADAFYNDRKNVHKVIFFRDAN